MKNVCLMKKKHRKNRVNSYMQVRNINQTVTSLVNTEEEVAEEGLVTEEKIAEDVLAVVE